MALERVQSRQYFKAGELGKWQIFNDVCVTRRTLGFIRNHMSSDFNSPWGLKAQLHNIFLLSSMKLEEHTRIWGTDWRFWTMAYSPRAYHSLFDNHSFFPGCTGPLILGANGKILNVEMREGGGGAGGGWGWGRRGGRRPVALYSDSLLHGSVLKVV
jgi:hypothetical protein